MARYVNDLSVRSLVVFITIKEVRKATPEEMSVATLE